MVYLGLGPAAAQKITSAFVVVKANEVPAVLCSFFTLFSILASYFLLLPLREDAGISLGTSTLPQLFICSLLVTLLFTPAASAFLSRPTSRDRELALKQFYWFMAFTLLVFYALYNFSAVEQLLGRATAVAGQTHHLQDGFVTGHSGPGQLQQTAGHTHSKVQQQRQPQLAGHQGQLKRRRGLLWSMGLDRQTSAADAQVTEEVAFTGRRLQHESDSTTSSSSNMNAADNDTKHTPGSSHDGGTSSDASKPTIAKARSKLSSRYGDPNLTGGQRLLRAAFYVWVNVLNLVGISSLWARCADAFNPEAGARLFGFISAGATLGQLAGSMLALLVTLAAEAAVPQQQAFKGNVAAIGASDVAKPPASGLILVAAVQQLVAAQLVCRVRPYTSNSSTAGAAGVDNVPGEIQHESVKVAGTAILDTSPPQQQAAEEVVLTPTSATAAVRRHLSFSKPSRAPDGGPVAVSSGGTVTAVHRSASMKQLDNMLSGFKLVLSSKYLLMLCGNLLLTYMVGSLMYFQRALVVSTSVAGPSHRAAFFATLNTWSAAGILVMQLFATSSLLSYLGMPAALGLSPVICLVGTLAVTLHPSPAMVAAFEVIRKLIGYAVHRPAREVLFTVVSRDEKYRAKLVIDTVVQRMGDAVAAAAFEILDVQLSLGQAGVGAAGCLVCLVWWATAKKLGVQHEQLAMHAQAAVVRDKADHHV